MSGKKHFVGSQSSRSQLSKVRSCVQLDIEKNLLNDVLSSLQRALSVLG